MSAVCPHSFAIHVPSAKGAKRLVQTPRFCTIEKGGRNVWVHPNASSPLWWTGAPDKFKSLCEWSHLDASCTVNVSSIQDRAEYERWKASSEEIATCVRILDDEDYFDDSYCTGRGPACEATEFEDQSNSTVICAPRGYTFTSAAEVRDADEERQGCGEEYCWGCSRGRSTWHSGWTNCRDCGAFEDKFVEANLFCQSNFPSPTLCSMPGVVPRDLCTSCRGDVLLPDAPPTPPARASDQGSSDQGLPAAVVGAILSGVIALLLLVTAALCLVHRRRSRRRKSAEQPAASPTAKKSSVEGAAAGDPCTSTPPGFIPLRVGRHPVYWQMPFSSHTPASPALPTLRASSVAGLSSPSGASSGAQHHIIQLPTTEQDTTDASWTHRSRGSAGRAPAMQHRAATFMNRAGATDSVGPFMRSFALPAPPRSVQQNSGAGVWVVGGEEEQGTHLARSAAASKHSTGRQAGRAYREEVLDMVRELSAARHVLHEQFVLMNRALRVGGQGCVQVAMFKGLQIEHKRAVVKTFFKHSDFVSEASLYLHSDVKQQCIVPACFATGAWEKDSNTGAVSGRTLAAVHVLSAAHQQQARASRTGGRSVGTLLKHDSIPYVVTEAGVTLKESLAEQRGSTIEDYLAHFKPLQVVRGVAEVLGRLHGLDFVHRDLKPSNIVDVAGEALHRDWRLIDLATHARNGQSVRPAFTLCYAAPETLQACMAAGPDQRMPQDEEPGAQQATGRSGEAVGGSLETVRASSQVAAPAVDVWALGVIAMELLTDMGSLPALTGEREAVEAALGRMTYPWESGVGVFAADSIEVLPGLPAEAVLGVLRGCLARDPGARCTAAAVVNALSHDRMHATH